MNSEGNNKSGKMKEPIVAFCCNHSGYDAYESACRELAFSDDSLRIVRVPCSGKIDIPHILQAFENGAYAVMVFACYRDNCRYIHGNVRAGKRVEDVKGILGEIGIEPERLEFYNVASNTPVKIKGLIEKMRETVSGLGPLKFARNE